MSRRDVHNREKLKEKKEKKAGKGKKAAAGSGDAWASGGGGGGGGGGAGGVEINPMAAVVGGLGSGQRKGPIRGKSWTEANLFTEFQPGGAHNQAPRRGRLRNRESAVTVERQESVEAGFTGDIVGFDDKSAVALKEDPSASMALR